MPRILDSWEETNFLAVLSRGFRLLPHEAKMGNVDGLGANGVSDDPAISPRPRGTG
jgi:hypothetical protein